MVPKWWHCFKNNTVNRKWTDIKNDTYIIDFSKFLSWNHKTWSADIKGISGLYVPRNQFVGNSGTWVRIPPRPPKPWNISVSGLFFCLFLSLLFLVFLKWCQWCHTLWCQNNKYDKIDFVIQALYFPEMVLKWCHKFIKPYKKRKSSYKNSYNYSSILLLLQHCLMIGF